jgi:hypothetical protein
MRYSPRLIRESIPQPYYAKNLRYDLNDAQTVGYASLKIMTYKICGAVFFIYMLQLTSVAACCKYGQLLPTSWRRLKAKVPSPREARGQQLAAKHCIAAESRAMLHVCQLFKWLIKSAFDWPCWLKALWVIFHSSFHSSVVYWTAAAQRGFAALGANQREMGRLVPHNFFLVDSWRPRLRQPGPVTPVPRPPSFATPLLDSFFWPNSWFSGVKVEYQWTTSERSRGGSIIDSVIRMK